MKRMGILTLCFFTWIVAVVRAEVPLRSIQEAIRKKGAKWTAGENWVAKLSREEQKGLLGTRLGPRKPEEARLWVLPKTAPLPAALDWRSNNGNWVTSVKNQSSPRSCGSCWDFSAVAQTESWWKIFNKDAGTDLNLSEQYILSCAGVGDCDKGGYVEDALDYIKTHGIPAESCFPYRADHRVPCSQACSNWMDTMVKIAGWGYVTLAEANVENIKNAVARHPVSAGFIVYSDFMWYSEGVYEYAWGSQEGGHAILIVGWNDADSSWICKNSWGPYWGENGYFRIKWGNCEIGTYVPFIFDRLLTNNPVTVNPQALNLTGFVGDTLFGSFSIQNLGTGTLEYSIIDYEVPVYFHPDDFESYDGSSWWCGDPSSGGYDDHVLQYLDTPELDLTNTQSPILSFMGYWAVEDPFGATAPYDGWDGCNVWISTDGGQNFKVITPVSPAYDSECLWSFGNEEEGWGLGLWIPGWAGSLYDWASVTFDLSSFRTSVIIRFAFASDMGWSTEDDPTLTGFFVDEIRVADGSNVLFEDSADDPGSMTAIGNGSEPADWIKVPQSVGTVAPLSNKTLEVILDTRTLSEGRHIGSLQFTTNVSATDPVEIPVRLDLTETTPVQDENGSMPGEFLLAQNYPNPFNATTEIVFTLPVESRISMTIYNASGQRVRTLAKGDHAAGTHRVRWDGLDETGRAVGSGLYLLRLQTPSGVQNRKLLLLR